VGFGGKALLVRNSFRNKAGFYSRRSAEEQSCRAVGTRVRVIG